MYKWFTIHTEKLDRHNDYVEVYFRQKDDGSFVITDDGYIVKELQLSGYDCFSQKEFNINNPRNSFDVTMFKILGIEFEGDSLNINSSPEALSGNIQIMIQAVVNANKLIEDKEEDI